MTKVLLTPEIEALIGQPMWDAETALVRNEDILRYLEMLGDPSSRDADGKTVAPPMFLPPFHHGGTLGDDGRRYKPRELIIDAPTPNRLMAGCEIDFGEPMRAGDIVTATTTVVDIYEKQGSTGPMLFIVTETSYRNQHGIEHRSERWTIIRR
jgi:hydroxyacyl-ACP dehydratase HTD2-like protein with hotdog domain